jgi:hypothetical protein
MGGATCPARGGIQVADGQPAAKSPKLAPMMAMAEVKAMVNFFAVSPAVLVRSRILQFLLFLVPGKNNERTGKLSQAYFIVKYFYKMATCEAQKIKQIRRKITASYEMNKM